MKTRMFKKEDYETIKNWWETHGWVPLPIEGLPPTGLIISNEDGDIAAGFLYDTDGNFMLMEWIVGNPDIEKEIRSKGLNQLIDALTAFAEMKGKPFVWTVANHPKLIERYEENGFKSLDRDCVHLVKGV